MPARRTLRKQILPNRRFARLLPAAMASVALAGASFAGPAAARADTQRAAHASPPPKLSSATLRRDATRRPS
ncbi:hypothetical protein [Candidatus Solirubrobacter pratensis]|uniref:hypothetical protein n=1 Tax=Candidatus Solirubrobacter pratensis TaxID=1298857 RepID=UPI00041DAF73|nr:hypothetical protein [Candidatus Solirubrobacter pratensis]